MDAFQPIHALITCCLTILSGVLTAIIVSANSRSKDNLVQLSEIKVKVNTLWEFLMRRAFSEAVVGGLGSANSPLALTDYTRHFFDPYIKELHDIATQSHIETDKDLFVAIEKRFGEEFLKKICVPNGWPFGASIWAAMELAREHAQIIDTVEGTQRVSASNEHCKGAEV